MAPQPPRLIHPHTTLPHTQQPKGIGRWPHVLQYVALGAQLGPQAAASQEGGGGFSSRLALSALGGVAWQLRRSLIDVDLLSMQVKKMEGW